MFVLAPVHRDPLHRPSNLRKLECFNKERFKELKGFLKEAVFLKEEEDLFSENGFQQKEEDNCKLDCERNSHDFSHLASKREAIWWEKENWSLVIDVEDPWGDLSREEGVFLKALLKG